MPNVSERSGRIVGIDRGRRLEGGSVVAVDVHTGRGAIGADIALVVDITRTADVSVLALAPPHADGSSFNRGCHEVKSPNGAPGEVRLPVNHRQRGPRCQYPLTAQMY